MSDKPTPGPWKAQHRIDLLTRAEAAIYGPDGDMVAMVYGSLGLDGDPMATASLIAAAPALLEALEAVEYKVDFDCYDDDGKCMSFCVDCGRPKGNGHYPDCKLGNALKMAKDGNEI
jgi:hypothetical protein